MARFSDRTVYETYRQKRMGGADHEHASALTAEALKRVYGERPDDETLATAQAQFETWRKQELDVIERDKRELDARLAMLEERRKQVEQS